MSYRVRVVDPSGAESSLCDLWSRNLGASCADPQGRLRWFYIENPAGPGVAHLLDRDGEDRPVGCMGLGMRVYACNGHNATAALFGDLAVDQKHRSLGPALMLQRATRGYAQENFPFSLGFPNAKALPSLLRLGFRELGPMIRYAVPLRHHLYLRRRLPEPLATLGAGLIDALTTVAAAPRFLAARALFHLENLAAPDARFDELWGRARSSIAHVAERSSSFLRWRFLHKSRSPALRIFALARRGTREVVAFAVVEAEGRAAHLRDLFGGSPADIASLLDCLLPHLSFDGYTSASFGFLGPTWMVDILTKHRFTARNQQAVVIDWGKAPPSPPERLMDPAAWFLTQADEDA
jgi:hypothetical protein